MSKIAEFRLALTLLTRLPTNPVDPNLPLSSAIWAYPLVGALVGGITGMALDLAVGLGLQPLAAALLALAMYVLLTGAMHEDGLADVADGFGGGVTRDAKLEIMRDSRIGTYGVVAVVLSLGLRTVFYSELPHHGVLWHLAGLGAISRALLPLMMLMLAPAKADGWGRTASEGLQARQVITALALAGLIGVITLPDVLGIVLSMAIAVAFVAKAARRHIGGFTGDVLGAATVVSELAGLVLLIYR